MLGEAGLGVAFHAKPAVAAAAHARIDHADLTALLFAQGYRGEDFVDPYYFLSFFPLKITLSRTKSKINLS